MEAAERERESWSARRASNRNHIFNISSRLSIIIIHLLGLGGGGGLGGLDVILDLALAQSLVESLAERQIGLTLGALDELRDLPRARTLRLVGR